MGEHHPLRDACCASSVEEAGEVIEGNLCLGGPRGISLHEVHKIMYPLLWIGFPVHLSLYKGKELLLGERQIITNMAGNHGLNPGLFL